MTRSFFFLWIMLGFACCSGHRPPPPQYAPLMFHEGDSLVTVELRSINDTLHVLHATVCWQGHVVNTSSYRLPYGIYQWQAGDIDNDGHTDIAVGVIKRTYYDAISRKRPFFFSFYHGQIRPLWLGSRLSRPLENFSICASGPHQVLRSVEREQDGTYLSAQYRWSGFGFRFDHYLVRNVTYKKANEWLTLK